MPNVTILNSTSQAQASSPGTTAQATIVIGPYPQQALILMTGQADSKYSAGGSKNAGILLILKVNGVTVGRDDSFEGESSNISFMVSASHNFLLAPTTTATVQANVVPLGTGGLSNINTHVRLNCFALAA